MALFLLKRVAESVLMLVLGSLLCFAFIRLIPGDPAAAMYGDQLQKLTEADRLRISENLGLDEQLPVQYIHWASQVLQGNWGASYLTGEPADEIIVRTLIPTAVLLMASQVIMIGLALFFGLTSALRRNGLYDRIVLAASVMLMAIPPFWLGLMMMLFFSIRLGVLPSSGMGEGPFSIPHLILPALVIALSHAGYYIRLFRNHFAASSSGGHLLALRARGVPHRRIILAHILPNAAAPLIVYTGASLAVSLAGSVVVESIFSWPGLGRLALKSALAHDYPVLLGVILLSMAFVILINLLASLLAAWTDPRLRGSGAEGRAGR
ncbi:ABC transporter permease [Bhargavaea cecembensis]|uniref:ABC transporter permease n=1 Tax=Bhargavaea cecembensis TaxID=394098 RepID=A0A163FG62_9BACL|nr:ABC transporter permease [Bhargavaea cecembensis]KZE38607.1 ABC transporter permease [Bhargavaea cecembensis]